MNSSKEATETGAVLIVTLVLLALLCTSAYRSAATALKIVMVHNRSLNSSTVRLEKINSAVQATLHRVDNIGGYCRTSSAKPPQTLLALCSQSLSSGSTTIRSASVQTDSDSHYRLLPYLNFNALITPLRHTCTLKTPHDLSSHSMTTAAVSQTTCLKIDTLSSHKVAVAGNIATEAELYFKHAPLSDKSYYIFSATGFISSDASIVSDVPLAIIAGGDVMLSELKISTAELPVIVFSATGNVSINNLVGAPRLSVLARGDVNIPAGVQLWPPDNLPEKVHRQILGFFVTDYE